MEPKTREFVSAGLLVVVLVVLVVLVVFAAMPA